MIKVKSLYKDSPLHHHHTATFFQPPFLCVLCNDFQQVPTKAFTDPGSHGTAGDAGKEAKRVEGPAAEGWRSQPWKYSMAGSLSPFLKRHPWY